MKKRLLLALFSFALTLVVAEVALHSRVVPSACSSGTLFGVELPPFVLIPWEEVDADERIEWSSQPSDVRVRGTLLAQGDLHGILREDPLLGHAPQEHAVSAHGWWQANNYGARNTRPLTPAKPPHKLRVLVFGDSYAHSSRVPEPETWCALLEALDERLEVWSFGVDGYGMGQAFLKFEQVAPEVDHDLALLMFVPDKSLWRDVNTIRYLGEGWESYVVNPRFVLEDDRLRPVRSPYENLHQMTEINRGAITEELREHLRRYDAYYIPWKYEAFPVLGRSILFQRWLAWRIDRREEAIERGLMEPRSEPQRIVKAIAHEMEAEARRSKRGFHLIVLPSRGARGDYQSDPDYRARWDEMVRFIGSEGLPYVDLMVDFARLPDRAFDRGYDHSHYGPRTNGLIARLVRDHILTDHLEAWERTEQAAP